MSTDSSSSSPDKLEESYKMVLKCTRQLEIATKGILGRKNSTELFVTSDQRAYMNEIASADPILLGDVVRQFINNLNETTSKNFLQLREIFIEELIKAYIDLPGFSDQDEEWECPLGQTDKNFLSSPSASLSNFENPWITKSNSTTNMPEEYKKYIEGKSFLDRYEIIRILRPFGPIEPTNSLLNKIKTR